MNSLVKSNNNENNENNENEFKEDLTSIGRKDSM